MSKKEDGEERPMLVGKRDDGKKKSSQRRQWLEKRRKRKRSSNIIDQNQKHRSGGRRRGTVRSEPTSALPPLSWSTTSLMCHLASEHPAKRTCLESRWQWAKSSSGNSTAILLEKNKQILFHPRTSSSTEVILSDRPLPLHGRHYWEIYVPAIYGTSIMFGIASKWKRQRDHIIT